jgi:hypothetical protein
MANFLPSAKLCQINGSIVQTCPQAHLVAPLGWFHSMGHHHLIYKKIWGTYPKDKKKDGENPQPKQANY